MTDLTLHQKIMVGQMIKYVQLLKASVLKHNGIDTIHLGEELDVIELKRCKYKQFLFFFFFTVKVQDNGIVKHKWFDIWDLEYKNINLWKYTGHLHSWRRVMSFTSGARSFNVTFRQFNFIYNFCGETHEKRICMFECSIF